MSKTNITIGFWLPTQVILLVLYYGGILPSLPWWIVWFPSLIIIGFIALAVVIMAIGAVLVTIFTIFGW